MKNILNLKSWQLFIVLFSPFIISSFISFKLPNLITLFTSLWLIIYLIWLYVLSTNLYKKLTKDNQKTFSIVMLKVNILLTFISLLVISISSHILIPALIKTILSIYSAVGLIYSIFFCAKILSKKENNQDSLFLNFVLLWFYPIGLWVLQPKVRAVFNNKGSENTAFANQ